MTLPTASSTMASVYTDFQGLNSLKAAAREQTPAAKAEAAKQFEAVFIEMMLKSMRAATPKNSLLGSSQERLYQGLYDHQIALNLAQGQGIGGLRTMIEKALGGTQGGTPRQASGASNISAIHSSSATVDKPAASKTAATPPDTAVSGSTWPPATPEGFVRSVLPYAREAAAQIGVAPAVLVAQAALETGWGRHVPAGANGVSSNNLFGIKAGASWAGATVKVPTLEYRDGVASRERASFRAYPSIAASFADYAKLISQHPRYQQAVAQGSSPSAYLDGLQQAGYATDPAYAAKVRAILGQNDFIASLSDIKNSGTGPLI